MAFSVTFVTNDEVCSRTWQPLLSDTVWSRRLPFFGHLIHASSCITRTTTKLCRLSLLALLQIEDEGLVVLA